jgi:uncharacterized membrane protein
MIEIIPNWHPIFVHFTVALFSIAVAFFLLAALLPKHKWHGQWLTVAHWNLWTGAAISLFTATAGWLAFNSVNHDTPSHEAMIEHRNLALITLAVFLPIAIWALARYRAGKPVQMVFLAALLVAQGLLLSTAWHGAELVYRYGLGVMSLPKKEGDGHAHQHSGDSAHGVDTAPHTDTPTPQTSGTQPPPTHNEGDGHAHDEKRVAPENPPGHVDDPARPHSH